jgi:hypothetical protein
MCGFVIIQPSVGPIEARPFYFLNEKNPLFYKKILFETCKVVVT